MNVYIFIQISLLLGYDVVNKLLAFINLSALEELIWNYFHDLSYSMYKIVNLLKHLVNEIQ